MQIPYYQATVLNVAKKWKKYIFLLKTWRITIANGFIYNGPQTVNNLDVLPQAISKSNHGAVWLPRETPA